MPVPPTVPRNSFARNTIYNVIGNCAPLLVALFSMPILVKGLGTERFGLLTLVWMVIGYYSLFDFGLSRALTKLVAERIDSAREKEVVPLAWSALFLMFLVGGLGACTVIAASDWFVDQGLNIPPALRQEAVRSFRVLSLALPFVICSAGLQGILEARRCFAGTNAVKVAMGSFNFWGPLLVLPFSRDLSVIVTALFIGRLISFVLYFYLCLRAITGFGHGMRLHRQWIKPLLCFGGWMTVSNIINPLLLAIDRLIIGAMLSMEAVAFYSTPYEMVMKLLVVPGALIGVFFPTFTNVFAQDRRKAILLYDRALKFTYVLMFPVALTLITFGQELLALWLGSAFSQSSTVALKWLSAGVFLNSLALFPFSLVQGAGRPDLTAKIHMFEAPVYVLVLWVMIERLGINGAAMAWTFRVGLDLALLVMFSGNIVQKDVRSRRRMFAVATFTLGFFAIAALLSSPYLRVSFYCLALPFFFIFTWLHLLSKEEKSGIKTYVTEAKLLNSSAS